MERECLFALFDGHALIDAAIIEIVVVGKRNPAGEMAAKLDPTPRGRGAIPVDRRREANSIDSFECGLQFWVTCRQLVQRVLEESSHVREGFIKEAVAVPLGKH